MQKCPFLYGSYLLSCGSSRDVYVPSNFELEEYCSDNRHKICPLYVKSMLSDYPAAKLVASKTERVRL
jgi:hypothetical protein